MIVALVIFAILLTAIKEGASVGVLAVLVVAVIYSPVVRADAPLAWRSIGLPLRPFTRRSLRRF